MSNSWAIITGGGTGIGRALTESLCAKNMNVLVVGRRKNQLEEVRRCCENSKWTIKICQADVSKEKDRQLVLDSLPGSAKVKYLVQNAAIGLPGRIAQIKENDFVDTLKVNVVAPLFLVKILLPKFQNGARILHLGTGLAHGPEAQEGSISYSVSKAAFHRLYEQLKVELKGYGVLVGSARPGVVATEGMLNHIERAKEIDLSHVQWFEELLKKRQDIPVKRVAKYLTFVLCNTADNEFSASEWHINDRTHWSRWLDGKL